MPPADHPTGHPSDRPSDHDDAARLDRARAVLTAAGGADLAPRPWQHPGQPPADTDLVRLAAWCARDPHAGPDVLAAGLGLLAAARAELDQAESALLFAARGAGTTWPQIAAALGLGSAQAAQQRLNRVLARLDEHADGGA